MCDTVVYLGPSLSRSEALSILEADYLPPICRGDLGKLPEKTRTVGIIDGEFFQNLSVSTKEIVAVLDRGIQVFGAASMGALRAAETHMFGTIGVGEIFRMFRDGVLDADDEVAVTYEPGSYRQLSDSLVNIRHVLEIALAKRAIDEAEKSRLLQQMKSLYFLDRSYRTLERLSPSVADCFRDSAMPDLKAEDARQLLLAIRNMQPARLINSSLVVS
jgi:hypothetical protein